MTKPTDSGRITRRLRAARAQALQLMPASGSIDEMVANVARSRGRRIKLVPHPIEADSPSGVWWAGERLDIIVFPEDAAESERSAVICHELSHMLLRHLPQVQFDQAAQMIALVAPNVGKAVAHEYFTRHGYADELEVEAEHLGTLMTTHLTRNARSDAMRRDAVSDRLR